ncbi:hypothetical protein L195_g053279, partial [Trifolium pratense]
SKLRIHLLRPNPLRILAVTLNTVCVTAISPVALPPSAIRVTFSSSHDGTPYLIQTSTSEPVQISETATLTNYNGCVYEAYDYRFNKSAIVLDFVF